MTKCCYNNQNGFGLIAILVVMTIIAAIFFGSSYFSQESQVETYVEIDRKTEEMINEIEIDILKRQEQIDETRN